MRLVFDIETNAVDFKSGNFLESLEVVWCIVAYDLDEDKWYEWHIGQGYCDLIQILEEADELIGHNIIQFDIPCLERCFGLRVSGKVTDTLVLSRLFYPDRPGGHSLESWGERLGRSKIDFGDFSVFTPEMLEYCRGDVRVNTELFRALEREQSDGDWVRAIALEHRIAEIIAKQEQNGFHFYKQQAQELVDVWTTRINSLDSDVLDNCGLNIKPGRRCAKPYKINGELTAQARKASEEAGLSPEDINGPFSTLVYSKPDLNSKQQQKELLLERGWRPETTTPTGQPKLDDSILKVPDVGPAIYERNVLSHRASQVQGLIDLTDSESRIHGGANPCGTNTGRMRHSRIVNIPRVTSPFGKEIRSLFGVPDTKCLVGYDAASLELRILAHYIGDSEYNVKVCSKDKQNDAHTLAAKAAGSSDRDLGKTINYALIYGAGDHRLGGIIGGTKRDGAVLRQRLYTEIPGLADLVRRVERASRKGYLIGLDGRKLWIRQQHQALNTLIQGGGAVFMKTVTEILDRSTSNWSDTFKVVDMHDEAQWEAIEDDVAYLTYSIQGAFLKATEKLELRCPQEAEVKVGKTWADTH